MYYFSDALRQTGTKIIKQCFRRKDFMSAKMAASLLRIVRLGSTKCVQAERWSAPAAAALCTKAGGPKKPKKSSSGIQLDPIQKLFLDSIREYSSKSVASGGLVDAGPAYEKNLAEELTKLQRLYGGGDITAFPEFKFTEPKLDEVASK
uniref:ATP synthase peripheral stalk subunit F6, mitochondrial n=1 Tax=Oncorhynchus kisutch TaxID=8019 RepID=A0A8C7DEM3_ONCKI